MSKPSVWVSLIVGLVLGAVGGRVSGSSEAAIAVAPKPSAAPRGAPVNPTVFRVPVEGSFVKGDEDALVTLVEFSDYQCPYCSRANATVRQLQARFGRDLRVVMKHHPLELHARALPAALAALAAGEQGKFWEMHERLFDAPKQLEDADLERHARELGLDVARWKQDLSSPKLAERIRQDSALALRLGAPGTPGFFINGRFLSGALPLEQFSALVEEELGKARAQVKAGTRAEDVYANILARGQEAAPARASPPPAQELPAQKVEVGTAPSRGPANAPVTLVAYSDFECPFCSRAVPTLKTLEQEYAGRLRVAFKQQPLAMHPHAKLAASAALAAHEQGKFWEMHDLLFSNQRALDRASLEGYAQSLGLDMKSFRTALDTGKNDARIAADMAEGLKIGAGATPTFFINGRPVVGAEPIDHFRRIIDDELRKAGLSAAR
ncbi:thioredoxin domain-containing protein [Myxococcaceae bacterium JPH2]|nr:thioredoxin domain-containing protein [Myxococcaceae bacterium JPH2]